MAKFLENCAAYQRYLKEVASGELEMLEYETVSKQYFGTTEYLLGKYL